jgi:DNA-binding CsgD family transcriptional regulator
MEQLLIQPEVKKRFFTLNYGRGFEVCKCGRKKGISSKQCIFCLRGLTKKERLHIKQENFCADCGKEISLRATRCKTCSHDYVFNNLIKNNPNWAKGRTKTYDEDELIHLHSQKLTDSQIAEKLNISVGTIGNARRSLGLKANLIQIEKKKYFCEDCKCEVCKGSRRCVSCNVLHINSLRPVKEPKEVKIREKKETISQHERYLKSEAHFEALKRKENKEEQTKILTAKIIELNSKGQSDDEIVKTLNISKKKVGNIRRKLGIKAIHKLPCRLKVVVPNLDKRIEELKNLGKSDRAISIRLHISKTSITRIRNKLGIGGLTDWGKGIRENKPLEIAQ